MVSSRDVTDQVELEHERARLELQRRVSQGSNRSASSPRASRTRSTRRSSSSRTRSRSSTRRTTSVRADRRSPRAACHRRQLDRRAPAPRDAEAADQSDLEYCCERIPAAFDRAADGLPRVATIVRAMKRFSHPDTTELSPADLNDGIANTLVVCRNEYKYVADVDLDLGELPPVTCHLGELNQVILNLVINAAQAIETGVAAPTARQDLDLRTRSRAMTRDRGRRHRRRDPAEQLDRDLRPVLHDQASVGAAARGSRSHARDREARGHVECDSAAARAPRSRSGSRCKAP